MIITKIDGTDIDTLIHIAEKTFRAAYAHLSKPEDIDAYTSAAFSREKLLTEFNDLNSDFYFAMVDNEPAGYLKLNYNNAQTEFKDSDAMEIEWLYVLPGRQRQQIGRQLLTFGIQKAIAKQLRYVWLGVWEINHKAISFYERNGFKITDRHTFPFGDEKDADLLMRRDLP